MMFSLRRRLLIAAAVMVLPLRGQDAAPAPANDNALYLDPGQPVEARINDLLPRLTLDEKIDLIGGAAFMHTHAIPRLKIPEIRMTDGPFGVREVERNGGWQKPVRVYAGGMALAATWDPELAQKVGVALGRDCRARGIGILLGPGMNLYRAPMSGRNWEYFGEDPLLSGTLGVGYIKGVQSQGVAATAKHFVANEQEFERTKISSDVDERTLRELYLKPFEMAVKDGGVWYIMDSYNPLNGVHTTENGWLNNDVLKKEWGFQGAVMSDWWATVSTEPSANAGLDLEMPGGPKYFAKKNLKPLIDQGKVTEATIDDKVKRLLRAMFTLGLDRMQPDASIPKDDPAGDQVALDGAREAVVLLKNEGNLLPLDPAKVKKIVVLGRNADPAVAVGGGSAHADYMHATSVLQGVKDAAGPGVQVIRVPWSTLPDGTDFATAKKVAQTAYGAPGNPPLPPGSIDDIKSADAAIICVGYNDYTKDYWNTAHWRLDSEGEGNDRAYDLPPGQVTMIQEVAKLNPHVIVVINAGGSVETADWVGQVPALLDVFYPGQAGGAAVGEILFGKTNPSGRLPFTWEKKWEDSPAYGHFPVSKDQKDNTYSEGVLLGYRWFDTKNVEPLFPFGFGLGYTTFTYSNLAATPAANGDLTATFTVQNSGKVPGTEVAELYIAPPQGAVPRPAHELKGFTRVTLQPGESKQVSIPVPHASLAYWDPTAKAWTVTPGDYQIQVGSSSRTLPLQAKVTVAN